MTSSVRKILGAFIVGSALVFGAFFVRTTESIPQTENLAIVVGQAAPRAYIATSDKNNDGIPDWQEALQRTDPVLLKTVDENYDLPDTLTGKFAIDFFQNMIRSKSSGIFGDNSKKLIENAGIKIEKESRDKLYGITDIIVRDDNSNSALRSYGNALATIALEFSLPKDTPNEIDILSRALNTNDEEGLKKLDPFIEGYTTMVEKLLTVPVPSKYTMHHLDVLNSLNAVANDITAMQKTFSDPLLSLIRIKRYKEDIDATQISILNLQKQIILDGVIFTKGDAVYTLFAQQ